MLNRYLDEIGHHDRQTLSESGLTVAYSHPRLPASIVAELSNTQLGKSVPLFTDSLFFTATESSTTGTSSDLSESDTESSDAEGERLDQVDPSTLLPARSYRPKRRATILAPTVRQVRRVTDPTNRPPPLRPRSHTISTPANRSTHPPSTDYPPAASPLPSRVDPLVGLKKVITELETATIQVDREAKKILASQESVADEIAAVVTEVNEIQIGIDQIDFQQVYLDFLIHPNSSRNETDKWFEFVTVARIGRSLSSITSLIVTTFLDARSFLGWAILCPTRALLAVVVPCDCL